RQREVSAQESRLREAERQAMELKHTRERLEAEAMQAEELKALNEELNRRQTQLERAMTARNRFYASMSHELRTPINAVLGNSTHDVSDAIVMSDPRRVRQILLNLLSNAIKFGNGKPITVCSHRDDTGAVRIEVSDQGQGIPSGDQERIFDEFVQLGRTQLQD